MHYKYVVLSITMVYNVTFVYKCGARYAFQIYVYYFSLIKKNQEVSSKSLSYKSPFIYTVLLYAVTNAFSYGKYIIYSFFIQCIINKSLITTFQLPDCGKSDL